jgi:hypothetical protein
VSGVHDLQQLVQDRLREMGDRRGPLSTRQAAARSGGKVSYETLRLIVSGRHSGNIGEEVAEGLALALDVPLSRIYTAAARRAPLGRFELPRRADRLNRSEREVILSVVDAILTAAGERAEPERRLAAVAHDPGKRAGGTREAAAKAQETARKVRRGEEPQR